MAPFMDREKVTKPTAQIGFIKFVLIPMFETVMKVSDEDESASLIHYISGLSQLIVGLEIGRVVAC